METIDINLIKIFNEGPEVSLNGSPTVSPTTLALCAAEPFPPSLPPSIYFLALSQEPPALAIITAKTKPETTAPAKRPISASNPINIPTTTGEIIASKEGSTISFCAALVTICLN